MVFSVFFNFDDNAKQKAIENGVIVLTTDKNSYEVAAEFSKLQ